MVIGPRPRPDDDTLAADGPTSVVGMQLRLGRRTRFAVSTVLFLACLAWVHEAVTHGRGWISTEVAPVVIVGNLVMSFGGLFRRYRTTLREIVPPVPRSSGRRSSRS